MLDLNSRLEASMSRALLSALLGAILAGSAHAQAVAPQGGADTSSWLSSRINGQAIIRVSGQWGTRYLAQPHLSGRSLTFAFAEPPDSGARPLLLDGVERIQVRGNAAGTGAVIGAGIGLAGGLALGIGLSAALCSGGLCSNSGGGTALIALGSTAGGALLGALIGSAARKWVTIYRSEAPQDGGMP